MDKQARDRGRTILHPGHDQPAGETQRHHEAGRARRPELYGPHRLVQTREPGLPAEPGFFVSRACRARWRVIYSAGRAATSRARRRA